MITHYGVRLKVDRQVFSARMVGMLYKSFYESPEVSILGSILQPDDRVLEVGAGIGFLACVVGRALRNPTQQILVAEANPELIALVDGNLAANGLTARVLNTVIGAKDGGTVPFYVAKDFWASSLLPIPGAKVVAVAQRSLAGLLREFRPNVLIMDIEGGEIKAMAGVDFTGVNKLLIELHPWRTGDPAASHLLADLIGGGFAIDFKRSQQYVLYLEKHAEPAAAH